MNRFNAYLESLNSIDSSGKALLKKQYSPKNSSSKGIVIFDEILEDFTSPNEYIPKFDFVLSCGDVPFHVLEEIYDLYKKPIFAVRGNHDPVKPFPKCVEDVHHRMVQYRNWLIISSSVMRRSTGKRTRLIMPTQGAKPSSATSRRNYPDTSTMVTFTPQSAP